MIKVTNYTPTRGGGRFGHGLSYKESEIEGTIAQTPREILSEDYGDGFQEPLLLVKVQTVTRTQQRGERHSGIVVDLDEAATLYKALGEFLNHHELCLTR